LKIIYIRFIIELHRTSKSDSHGTAKNKISFDSLITLRIAQLKALEIVKKVGHNHQKLINKYNTTINYQAKSIISSDSLINTDGSNELLLIIYNVYSIITETNFIQLSKTK